MTTQVLALKHFTDFMNENVVRERDVDMSIYGLRTCKKLAMKDGTEISIQASSSHYCNPRQTTEKPNYAWYESFELGFPTKEIDDLIQYAEDQSNLTGTVYGYVPKHVVEKVIDDCGGVSHAITVGEVV